MCKKVEDKHMYVTPFTCFWLNYYILHYTKKFVQYSYRKKILENTILVENTTKNIHVHTTDISRDG